MAAPLQSSMPQFTELGYSTTVTLEALDPTTGADVSGVVVSNVGVSFPNRSLRNGMTHARPVTSLPSKDRSPNPPLVFSAHLLSL